MKKKSEAEKDKGKGKEIKLKDMIFEKKELRVPLVLPESKEDFEIFWKTKPIADSRYYEIENLYASGMNLFKFLEPQGWIDFFKMNNSVYPDVVRSFYYNAIVHPDKNLIISFVKGLELQLTPEAISHCLKIHCEGNMLYGSSWYDALQIKKDELILDFLLKE
ncbi:hypothetical protein L195_g056877, partial [Trifolium pratense]